MEFPRFGVWAMPVQYRSNDYLFFLYGYTPVVFNQREKGIIKEIENSKLQKGWIEDEICA
ncbi:MULTISPECIES: hypothetical protein [unclassified Peribacillus]|uniref:hypothetical protein n=1 Tax=unclassified Peribacillus TaxID=2675266 RepID=UPI001911B060|nr:MULTISPECIES: hypothetical protein [unclassified Peribacillus]MBK5446730.1 hypothetical protein [Peribacillus sp. TH24]MBK5502929.1 hypothetical protein [Peribacillus sp. TH14]WMX58941.1 hypothetical protein RE409_29875 [Peribacillus sp. R9-11]